MKEISRQSLMKIHDVIHGENYVNIKARLNQLLPRDYAETFAGIKFISSDAVWFGEDSITYKPYHDANDVEREEIASWLDNCRTIVISTLSASMPFVSSLFTIPAKEQIYWYRDSKGELRVVLTQWGFENKYHGAKVDVIDMLLSAPRTLTQESVTIHVDYSDGLPAENCPFILYLFNNTKELCTDENGDYYLGRLFANKTFSISNANGDEKIDFVVQKGGQYNAVFDLFTNYKLIFENQNSERLGDYHFSINGAAVTTNDEGCYESRMKLVPGATINVKAGENSMSFPVGRIYEENVFLVRIEEKTSPPPPIPEYVKIVLLDFDGKPLPNLHFTIKKSTGDKILAETDDAGEAKIDKSLLEDNNRYKVEFKITSSYRKEHNKIRHSNGK